MIISIDLAKPKARNGGRGPRRMGDVNISGNFPQKNEYADWIVQGVEALPSWTMPVPYNSRDFIRNGWPVTAEYFSPFNAIFLVQCVKREQLNRREFWLLRDGISTLRNFFATHPTPAGLKCKLYVEESAARTVPKPWLGWVGTYRVISRQPKKPITKCILCDSVVQALHSEAGFEARIQHLDFARIRGLMKSIYVPWEHDGVYLSRMTKILGGAVTPIDLHAINLADSFEGYEYIDLSGREFCLDSYFAHVILAKGGYLEANREIGSGRFVSLSPFHGYVIHEEPFSPREQTGQAGEG
jgi:hypothetical protein